jgi:hypothetical protein
MQIEPTIEAMLEKWTLIIRMPRCPADIKAKAIREVYEIGIIAGKLEGAQQMGDSMMAALRNKPDVQPA